MLFKCECLTGLILLLTVAKEFAVVDGHSRRVAATAERVRKRAPLRGARGEAMRRCRQSTHYCELSLKNSSESPLFSTTALTLRTPHPCSFFVNILSPPPPNFFRAPRECEWDRKLSPPIRVPRFVPWPPARVLRPTGELKPFSLSLDAAYPAERKRQRGRSPSHH